MRAKFIKLKVVNTAVILAHFQKMSKLNSIKLEIATYIMLCVRCKNHFIKQLKNLVTLSKGYLLFFQHDILVSIKNICLFKHLLLKLVLLSNFSRIFLQCSFLIRHYTSKIYSKEKKKYCVEALIIF